MLLFLGAAIAPPVFIALNIYLLLFVAAGLTALLSAIGVYTPLPLLIVFTILLVSLLVAYRQQKN